MNTQIEESKPKLKRVTRTLAVARSSEPSVALMLEKIIDKGITAENVSALELLVGLYDRMQAKQAEIDFAKAFSELQSEMPRVVATKPVPNRDGTIRYRFAPYEEILEQVQPYLSKHGFSVSFDTAPTNEILDGRMTAICTLRHISGHSQSNRFSVRIGSGPPGATETQADGSAKTYAKRGALSDALNIVVDHDDDARMIGKPIGKALAEDLLNRVKLTGSNMISFLKYAGVDVSTVDQSSAEFDPLELFMRISDEHFESLDELLKRKEAKAI